MGGFAYLMDKDGTFRNSFSDGWDRILSKHPIPFYYCIGNDHGFFIIQLVINSNYFRGWSIVPLTYCSDQILIWISSAVMYWIKMLFKQHQSISVIWKHLYLIWYPRLQNEILLGGQIVWVEIYSELRSLIDLAAEIWFWFLNVWVIWAAFLLYLLLWHPLCC
jgi:hypothetical protein